MTASNRVHVRIRDAAMGESSLLARIVLESRTYTGPDLRLLAAEADRIAQLPAATTRVALADGQVAGFYRLVDSTRCPSGDLELDYLLVHSAWRGWGIGRALTDDLHHTARHRGATNVHIVAHPPTEGFFRRVGAKRTGTQGPQEHRRWYCPTLALAVRPAAASAGSAAS